MTYTCFVAMGFSRRGEGMLVPGVATPCSGAQEAENEALRLASDGAGAIAFSRSIDIDTGTAERGTLLQRFGEVPSLEYLLG